MFLVLYCADHSLTHMIRSALGDEYCIRHTTNEARLAALLRSHDVLGVIIDGGSAQIEECCQRINAATDAPLLAIAPGDEAGERTRLLLLGADDVLTRQFCGEELRARLHAKLRRARWEWQRSILASSPQGRHGCSTGHTRIHLTPAEAQLLRLLQQHAGSFVAVEELRRALWDEHVQLGRLRYHICHLRRRLAEINAQARIETRRGNGYRLVGSGVAVW